MTEMPYDTSTLSTSAIRQILDQAKLEGRSALTAPEGKRVCDAYGIAVPKEGVAHSAKEAVSLAAELGFPVVMKIVSPDILHKTEAAPGVAGIVTQSLGNTRKRLSSVA